MTLDVSSLGGRRRDLGKGLAVVTTVLGLGRPISFLQGWRDGAYIGTLLFVRGEGNGKRLLAVLRNVTGSAM